MKMDKTQGAGFMQWLQRIGMLFLILILVVFYAPEMKFYHAELPN